MTYRAELTAAALPIHEAPLAILDIESSGFYTADLRNKILELSVIRRELGGEFYVAFDSLFSAEGRPLGPTRVHGIRERDLRGAPTFAEAAERVAEALSGAVWVAYNASFDRNFVTGYLKQSLGLDCEPPYLCAQRLRSVLKLGKATKLKQACDDFSVPFDEGHHVAIYDTWATAQLTQVWLERMEDLGLKTLGDLETLSPKSKFIESLSLPLWERSAEGELSGEPPLKSRYAIKRGLAPHATALPLPSEPIPVEEPAPATGQTPKRPRPASKSQEEEIGPSQSDQLGGAVFQLRSYQTEAIRAIAQRRRAGVKRQVVCLPTGAGKTVIFSELARRAKRRVLVLAHREELLSQAQDKLERALQRATTAEATRVKVDIEQAQRVASPEAKVVIASLRSLRSERLARLIAEEGFGLIIYDECHHAVAEDNQRVLRELGVFKEGFEGTLVGFTATTRRADGVGLDEVFEEVVYSRSLIDMLRDQYLVPVRGYRVDTSVSLEGLSGRGDFVVDELADRVDIQERNGLVARSIQELARDRRTICFCVTVQHAESLAETLRSLGVPAATVHGEMKSLERASVLRDFREGALQVLTNVGVLTEGFDDPALSCVAMARPTKSEALYVQCVGRGMRLAEGKEDCLVIDFVDLSAMNLVTLPSLVGMPVEIDFEGRELLEGASAYQRLMDEQPGFEWEAQRLSLSELQERVMRFDPLKIKLPSELRAISQNGWVSLGQRGVALHFFYQDSALRELVIWQTSEPGPRRYVLKLDDREVGRARSVEEGVEAADYEIGRMGYCAVETALHDATWRHAPPPREALEPLRSARLPTLPTNLEELFRATLYLKLFSSAQRSGGPSER